MIDQETLPLSGCTVALNMGPFFVSLMEVSPINKVNDYTYSLEGIPFHMCNSY
jgi:hypothetical protein